MAQPSSSRFIKRLLGIIVLLVAAIAGAVVVLAAGRIDERIRVTVRIDGSDEVVTVASNARVSDAFVKAGFAPHNGRLLSAKNRLVLDPRHDPAVITINGEAATDGHPLTEGAVIEAIDGIDETEETETVREPIPIPPLRDDLRHVHEAGEEGLAERVIGVRSREVVEETILQEAEPAKRTRKQVVALTFDDGPNTTWTPEFLDLLKEKKVKATFCLVGENVGRHPDIARRIVKEGHQVCNHSSTHPTDLDGRTKDEIDDEIGGAVRTFTTEGLPSPPYYRPPGGVLSDEIREVAWSYDEHVIHWKVDTNDWKSDATIESILENVDREVDAGAIILLHDGGGRSRAMSLLATAVIIDHLKDQGYEFVFPFIED